MISTGFLVFTGTVAGSRVATVARSTVFERNPDLSARDGWLVVGLAASAQRWWAGAGGVVAAGAWTIGGAARGSCRVDRRWRSGATVRHGDSF